MQAQEIYKILCIINNAIPNKNTSYRKGVTGKSFLGLTNSIIRSTHFPVAKTTVLN
jgi:hypothetical protein